MESLVLGTILVSSLSLAYVMAHSLLGLILRVMLVASGTARPAESDAAPMTNL